MPSRTTNRKWVLDGTVCTIHLRLTGAIGNQFRDLVKNKLEPARPQLKKQLENGLLEALGPHFHIGDVFINAESNEILVRIDATSHTIKSCTDLERALTRFVFYLQDILNGVVREDLSHVSFHGHWFPAPPLIRMQMSPPEKRKPILKQVQQPLVTLLLGTLLGSALIPWIQSRSNAKRIRREERTKLALAIIDQNRETNSQLGALQTAVELFAKDHANPRSAVVLAKQRDAAREDHNLQYLSFDRQAWWWFWSVQMKAQLSSLATPTEAKNIKNLANQYNDTLADCVQVLSGPWNSLLREDYNPATWKSITEEAGSKRKEIDDCRIKRDDLALRMAMVFASD